MPTVMSARLLSTVLFLMNYGANDLMRSHFVVLEDQDPAVVGRGVLQAQKSAISVLKPFI